MPKLVDRLKQSPQLADVASDLQDKGLQAFVDIDRDAASRLGVSVSAIDDALYDAFGQRLISTIYTQANQYRVVLEAAPRYQLGPESLGQIHVAHRHAQGGTARQVAARQQHPRRASQERRARRAGDQPRRPVPGGDDVVQPRARRVARRGGRGHRGGAAASIGMPASIQTRFQGAAEAFRASLDSTLLLILAAIVTMYIVLGVLYESYIHPITILSTLPSAGVGALLALLLVGTDLSLIAIIGIILLIGIVKKNAIMMIDFALDAERNEGMAPRRRDLPGGAAALPADPDDDAGGAVRRAAADVLVGLGRRAAPAARPGDGRRPARQPGADAVHDAGHLPVLRSPRPPLATAPQPKLVADDAPA